MSILYPRYCRALLLLLLSALGLIFGQPAPAQPGFARRVPVNSRTPQAHTNATSTAPNILAAVKNTITEYTQSGSVVRTLTIPSGLPGQGIADHPRDLVIGPDGAIYVYNGDPMPYVSRYDAVGGWTNYTFAAWSAGGNASYGGITADSSYLYATDFGAGADHSGIIRFSLADGSGQRFFDGTDFIDVNLGQDGLLYAVRDLDIDVVVIDPRTMTILRTVVLPVRVRATAVDTNGDIYGVVWDTGDIYHFTSTGTIVKSINSGTSEPLDIDIDAAGQLVIGAYDKQVVLTDTTLTSVKQVAPSGFGINGAFVTFVPSPAGPTGPPAPTSLTATVASPSQVNLSWKDNSTNETGFKIQRKTGAGAYTTVSTVGANVTVFTDTGVSAGLTYTYQVLATNANGDSTPSNTVTVTTPGAPPTAPSGLTATAVSATRVDLQWTDNSTNEDSFEVQRSTGGSYVSIGAVGVNATTYSDTTAAPATTYTYRVRAIAGGAMSSFATSPSVTTPSVPIAAPSNLTATLSGIQVSLAWSDNSGNEDRFIVERATGTGSFASIGSAAANAVNYLDSTTQPNTNYSYRVRAALANSTSSTSNTVSVSTPNVVPAPATALTAAAGPGEIDLSWRDASSNEDGFRIERSTDGAAFTPLATVSANLTTYRDAGLPPDSTYYYRVRAYNTVGDSAPSNTASATTLPAIPAPPSGLHVTDRAQTTISLAWTGSPGASTYEVERGIGAFFSRVGTVVGTTFSDGGLTPSTNYSYRVRAVNAGGASDYSSTLTTTTLIGPPTAPTGFHAFAVSTTAIQVSWYAPSGPLTGYLLERSTDGGASWTPIGPPANPSSTYVDEGLQADTTYQYRLRATTEGGDGPYAGPVSATTLPPPPDPPAAPRNLRVSAVTGRYLVLAWDASAGATSYTVERKSGAAEYGAPATVANETSFMDATAVPGITYTYRLKARNAGGDSDYVTLTTAIPAHGKLKLSTTNLKFGTVAHGKAAQKSFTVSNKGTGILIVTVSSPGNGYSVVSGSGMVTLRPGQKLKVTVRFAPIHSGGNNTLLGITSTDPAYAQVTVQLTGAGK